MIGGFCIKLLTEKNICPRITHAIEDNEKENACNKFIKLQDRGGLKYPTALFSGFIKSVFDCMDGFKTENHTKRNVWNFWTSIILASIPSFLVCGCGNNSHSELLRKLIVAQIVKIQLVNSTAEANDQEDKPKFTRKPLSKKVKKL